MDKNTLTASLGEALAICGTAIQTNEILQIISLIISIVGGLITIAVGLSNWWHKSKADGKITKEEINEGLEILNNGIDTIKKGEEQWKNSNKK